jgi:deoxyuridine 5'-triphosphate nucleotidohydrolase
MITGIFLPIFKEHPDAIMPTVAYGNSAGLDIYSIEDVIIPAKGYNKVKNGLRIIFPEDHFGAFRTRSSMGFLKNLFVYEGTFDPGYSGPLDLLIYNFSDLDYTIKKGDKYAQLVFHKIIYTHIKEINQQQFEESTKEARGYWGSSGV